MPALVAYIATLVISGIVLALDALTGGAFGRFLLDLGSPFWHLGGVKAETVRSMIVLYLLFGGAFFVVRQWARQLVGAGQPPAWADNFLAVDLGVRRDTRGWSIGLAVVVMVIGIGTLPGVAVGAVAIEPWTLFALLGVTLVWHALESVGAPVRWRVSPGVTTQIAATPLLSPHEMLEKVRGWERYRGQLRAVRSQPARAGKLAAGGIAAPRTVQDDWAADMRPGGLLHSAMGALGIAGSDRLYAHQAAALEAALTIPPPQRVAPHILLATPPGSGRATTIFLAILARTLRRGEHVLVIAADDEALARERARFHDLAAATEWRYALYDGVIPAQWDGSVPDPPPEVLFCTLDSLHRVLLRDHAVWREFWSDLALIVMPDVDRYIGILGANAVQVCRRVRRLAAHYGRIVQFLATAAPADDLEPFARNLWSCAPSEEVRCEQNDSTPRPVTVIALWMPPLDRIHTPGARPNRRLERQGVDDAAVDLGVFFAREPDYRFIFYWPGGDAVSAQRLRDRIVSGSGKYLGQEECRVVTTAVDVPERAEEYDALIILGPVQRFDEATRVAGRLGARRNGGLLFVVSAPSPAMARLVRGWGQQGANAAESADVLATAMLANPVSVLPLDGNQAAVVRKHLACALFELPMEEREVATLWGEEGKKQFPTLQAVARRIERGDGERVLRWHAASAAPPHDHCPLETLGMDDATVIAPFSTDNSVALRIDTNRAACAFYPGRRLLRDGGVWVLAPTPDGYEARPPATDGNAVAVPLYTVRASVPSGSAATESHIGDGIPVGMRRGPLAITQTLVATRLLPADGPPEHAIISPVESEDSAAFVTDCLVITGARIRPLERAEAFALAHLLHATLRATLPETMWREEVMVAAVEGIEGLDGCGAAVLIYETAAQCRAVAASLAERWTDILRDAYRTALVCPCKDGCAACMKDPWDRVYAPANPADKRAVLRYLGAIFGSEAADIAGRTPSELDGVRYEYVSDIGDLISIAADVHRYGLRPLLGSDGAEGATVRFMTKTELQDMVGVQGFFGVSGLGGPYVAVSLKPEEDLVGLLAHELTHDWQIRTDADGTPHFHPSLRDPERIPYQGLLFLEGVAQWAELRVLDGYGFKRDVEDVHFRVFDEYGEGYHTIKLVEERGGIAGVLAFLRSPADAVQIDRLLADAGTKSRIYDSVVQLADGAIRLPPSDIRIEAPVNAAPPLVPVSMNGAASSLSEDVTAPSLTTSDAAAEAAVPAENAAIGDVALPDMDTHDAFPPEGTSGPARRALTVLLAYHWGILRRAGREDAPVAVQPTPRVFRVGWTQSLKAAQLLQMERGVGARWAEIGAPERDAAWAWAHEAAKALLATMSADTEASGALRALIDVPSPLVGA